MQTNVPHKPLDLASSLLALKAAGGVRAFFAPIDVAREAPTFELAGVSICGSRQLSIYDIDAMASGYIELEIQVEGTPIRAMVGINMFADGFSPRALVFTNHIQGAVSIDNRR